MVDHHFSVKAPAEGYSYALGDGHLLLSKLETSSGPYWRGEFLDGRGIVAIYRQSDWTSLSFAHEGRAHNRSWRRYFGDRTIARLSRAFITDVLAGTAA